MLPLSFEFLLVFWIYGDVDGFEFVAFSISIFCEFMFVGGFHFYFCELKLHVELLVCHWVHTDICRKKSFLHNISRDSIPHVLSWHSHYLLAESSYGSKLELYTSYQSTLGSTSMSHFWITHTPHPHTHKQGCMP